MMKRLLLFAFIGSVVFIFQNCASRNWFEGAKEVRRQECYKIESPTGRQACLDEVNQQSYDQYEKEREVVVQKTEQK